MLNKYVFQLSQTDRRQVTVRASENRDARRLAEAAFEARFAKTGELPPDIWRLVAVTIEPI